MKTQRELHFNTLYTKNFAAWGWLVHGIFWQGKYFSITTRIHIRLPPNGGPFNGEGFRWFHHAESEWALPIINQFAWHFCCSQATHKIYLPILSLTPIPQENKPRNLPLKSPWESLARLKRAFLTTKTRAFYPPRATSSRFRVRSSTDDAVVAPALGMLFTGCWWGRGAANWPGWGYNAPCRPPSAQHLAPASWNLRSLFVRWASNFSRAPKLIVQEVLFSTT